MVIPTLKGHSVNPNPSSGSGLSVFERQEWVTSSESSHIKRVKDRQKPVQGHESQFDRKYYNRSKKFDTFGNEVEEFSDKDLQGKNKLKS